MWKAVGQYEKIKEEANMKDTRHLLLSKTFWANVLGLALTIGGILPAKYAAVVIPVANMGLRLISSGAVTLLPQPKDE